MAGTKHVTSGSSFRVAVYEPDCVYEKTPSLIVMGEGVKILSL